MPSLLAKLMGPSSGRERTKRQRLLRRLIRPAWLGTLRRTTPLSDRWGWDRGTPVDRYYMEHFLDEHRQDIRGHVLEVEDSAYIERFGMNVERSDVLDINPANPHATIVADLSAADSIPADVFDCIILTQTLEYIYRPQAAVAHIHRILRPGGVLLATVPGIIKMDPDFVGTDYWRFTVDSCSTLFGEVFGQEQVKAKAYGNVLTAIAFLTGMAYQELSHRELESHDASYPVLVAVRAVKCSEEIARQ